MNNNDDNSSLRHSSFCDDDDDDNDTLEKRSILNDNHPNMRSYYEDMINNNKLDDITNSEIFEAHETSTQSYESMSNVFYNSSIIIDDDEEQKNWLRTDISTSNLGQDTSVSNSDDVVVKSVDESSSISIMDPDHDCEKTLEKKNPSHNEVVAREEYDDVNSVVAILNDVNGNHVNVDTSGLPDYKDQVNNIRSTRNNINYQKSGGVAEFIITNTNHTNNIKRLSPIIPTMRMAGLVEESAITSSYNNTNFIEDNFEQVRNENANDQHTRPGSRTNYEIESLSCEIIQSSAMTDMPEQENLHEDHPVFAEAYTVSSFIIEAKPFRRNYHLIIILVIIICFVMIIAGIVLGVLCQNGSCKSNSTNGNNNNESKNNPSLAPTSFRSNNDNSNSSNINVYVDVRSSAPTSQRQPISDNRMLMSLVDQYINETFNNLEDDDTTKDKFGMIEYWDVTNVTDLSSIFATWRNKEIISFNADISHWDVQNAINMDAMFRGTASFNGNLSLWDVSSVESFSYMFSDAKSLLGIGLENWLFNLIFVNDISYMFTGATLFDCNLSNWDVSGVSTMIETFANAQKFRGIGLEHWNTSQLTNASSMFAYASLFAGDLSHWDVSQVQSMNQMFEYSSSFNSNLSSWDVRSVTDMSYMFRESAAFNGNGLSSWDVSNVEDMSSMFERAISLNADLSNWNVSLVSSMSNMFAGAYIMFNSDLSRWDVSSVVLMSNMFSNADKFNSDLSRWDVSRVRDLSGMFLGTSYFNSNLSNWDVSNVDNLKEMFAYSYSFTGIGLSNWNVSNVQNIDFLFENANQFDADLSRWDVSRVTTMMRTFGAAYNYTGIGIDQWNVENVVNMYCTFCDTPNFNANLSLWNVTKVSSMAFMFNEALSFRGNGLSEWNVKNVEFFNYTFAGSSIIDVDLSKWNVQSATSMTSMFANTPNFDSNLSNWNVTSIQDFSYMFYNATSFRGIGLENWILNDNAVLDGMFCGADSFDPKYISAWNITSKNVFCCAWNITSKNVFC